MAIRKALSSGRRSIKLGAVQLVILIGAAIFAAASTLATNWLALIPWRRAQNQHWTERARLSFPVRSAAASSLWVIPAALTSCILLLWPSQTPHWALLVLFITVGTALGNLPIDRELFPRIALRDLLRQMMVLCLIRFLMWFVVLGVAASMPPQFNLEALFLFMAFLFACGFWNRNAWIYLGRKLGLFEPAPERLQRIVQETSVLVKVPYSQLWLMRISLAQAFAMPGSRVLLFSERMLELLSDEEIAAVCCHELAHLAEPRQHSFQRYVIWLIFLPWVLFKPIIHTFGVSGFFLLLLITAVTPIIFRRISCKLEARAADVAHLNERGAGTYARALLRLHEDGLVPAVVAKKRATHPHLYDRLLAVGFTPDFARPKPAASMAWPGIIWSCVLGVSAMSLVMRMIQSQ
jgi:Zn-dependent protease with chaperone function